MRMMRLVPCATCVAFSTIVAISSALGEPVNGTAKGIVEATRNKLILRVPPDKPRWGSIRYSLPFPFQADRNTMGLMVMRMIEETTNYGFLDGSDIILLDELKQPRRNQIFAGNRNEVQPAGANTPQRLILKSPLIGGFVPRGAMRGNGKAHPHAGTGFAIAQAHLFSFANDQFTWGDPDRKDMNEAYQLTYDGRQFKCRRVAVGSQNGNDTIQIGNSGWSILVTGITSAIPDGDDLLQPTLAAKVDRSAIGTGIVRWQRRSGTWRPAEYEPVATIEAPVPEGSNPMERCPWMEPSLTREQDGSLLFSARGGGSLSYTFAVWRRNSDGSWQQLIDRDKARLNSPVTLNVALDGTPYLVSSPYDPAFVPETQQTGRGREKLAIWPLAPQRTDLEPPLVIRDCLSEFGPPPSTKGPEKWMADHANGLTVRLKDGKWHHLLCYRVCHSPPYLSHGTPPSPHSGGYIEEVISRGTAKPLWKFASE